MRNGADVQIGGGVRVGDAFQAIVEFNLIAMWGMQVCVEISQARPRVSFASNKGNTHRPFDRAADAKHPDW